MDEREKDGWTRTDQLCPACKADQYYSCTREDDDIGDDEFCKCFACGHFHYVEGSDAQEELTR